MKKNNFILYAFILGLTFGVVSFTFVSAKSDGQLASLKYPIAELGGCKSESGCKAYCDNPDNIDACLTFALKNGLMSKEEVLQAQKFKKVGLKGPGGCSGKEECEVYCGSIDHMEACIVFAKENDLMSSEELEESEKVLSAIRKGVKPPACGGKKQCDAYCSSSEHMEECITFAIEAGLMPPEEQENVSKMLSALKRGVKPPACGGKKECDAYCSAEENMEECITFAIEADMMPETERENAQKMLTALKKGIRPPACRGDEECRVYCSQEEHTEECIRFGEASGMMSKEDAEMMRKTGGRGPGGCNSKEECENFCGNPDNEDTCSNFAIENNLISEDDKKRMREGQESMKNAFSQMPSEVLDCVTSGLGVEAIEKIRAGTMQPSRKIGVMIQSCFERYMKQKQLHQPEGEREFIYPPDGDYKMQQESAPIQIMDRQIEQAPMVPQVQIIPALDEPISMMRQFMTNILYSLYVE